jgi:PKD repeat protein
MLKKLTMVILASGVFLGIFSSNIIAKSFEKITPKMIPLNQIVPTSLAPLTGDKGFCLIQSDNNAVAYYFGGFGAGDGFAIYMDPAQCGLPDPYPFKITDVHFYLFDPGGYTWPVQIQVNIRDLVQGYKCNGPGDLLCSQTYTIYGDSAYPDLIHLNLDAFCCVQGPFFLEIMYTGGTSSPYPSLMMTDPNTNPADTCDAWAWYLSQGYSPPWWEWSDFWSPPVPGYPVMRITGYTQTCQPVIANFSAEPTSGLAPLEVHFTDLSTGNPISWFWNFGDDSTSTTQNPIHVYSDTGYFDVKLVVSNATETDSVIKYNYIHAYCVGHIAGFVKDTLGLPIYPAQVEVVELSETRNTDPTGYYEFTDLISGSYTLSAEASGYATVETLGVNVVCEETTQVNFILRSAYFSVSNSAVYNSLIYGLTTGDFNADNNVDIIARGWYDEPGTITRLWGNGDGTFTRQTPIEIFGYVLVGGYFNSDDFLDLAVGMYDSLAILLNDGTGNFLPPKCFDLHGSSPLSIATGYLNSDAYLDLVTANMNELNLSIFRGTGTGDFAFVKNLDLYSYYIDMSDFNKDGKTDLVVGDSGALSVNLGDGNWNFTQSYSTYFGDINSVSTMNSLADFNHDGNLDLIFCIPYYPVPGPSRIGILLGDGEGGFSSVKIIHSPNASTFAAAPADFDGDNNLDFAVTYHDAIKVYFGDGTGNFPRSILTPIDQVNASASLSLVAADFNKDGNADLAAGRVDPWVSVLLNLNSPKPTIEDEFVLTGYTSVNLAVTDPYGSTANILANAIAGADYFQKDCNSDSDLDDRVYNFNAFPGRYRVGVTPRPGSEPGAPASLGIRINGSVEVSVAIAKEGFQSESNDTIFFIVTDSLPILRLPANTACFCKDTLTFFWNQIEGTSQYHFQLDDTIDFSSPVIDDPAVTDTSFSLTSPLSGKKYYWRVRANGGVWSVFSETYSFFPHLCGDMNGDCKTSVLDVVYLINRLFISGPDPVCILSADVNSDGQLNVSDVVYLINYLFLIPPGPPPSC